MTQTNDAQQILATQRDTWDAFAPGWERWDDVVQTFQGPVASAMVSYLDVAEETQHLDVAAGTGEPGLSIAALAPAGSVVLTDLSTAMLEAAARRAAARGLANVLTRECSADSLPFPDATFDSVSCRFGFMFFPDLAVAASELVRVLKPDGRLCAAVWAELDANPWASIAGQAVATEVDVPPPPPGAPGMFRCAEPRMLADILSAAGLHDVVEWEVPIDLSVGTPQRFWELVTDCTAPIVAVLSQLDEAARQRVADVAVAKVREISGEGDIHLRGTARCVGGTR